MSYKHLKFIKFSLGCVLLLESLPLYGSSSSSDDEWGLTSSEGTVLRKVLGSHGLDPNVEPEEGDESVLLTDAICTDLPSSVLAKMIGGNKEGLLDPDITNDEADRLRAETAMLEKALAAKS